MNDLTQKFQEIVKMLESSDESINQERISEALGYDESYISKMIDGKFPISNKAKKRIIKAFHINVNWLDGNSDKIFDDILLKEYRESNPMFIKIIGCKAICQLERQEKCKDRYGAGKCHDLNLFIENVKKIQGEEINSEELDALKMLFKEGMSEYIKPFAGYAIQVYDEYNKDGKFDLEKYYNEAPHLLIKKDVTPKTIIRDFYEFFQSHKNFIRHVLNEDIALIEEKFRLYNHCRVTRLREALKSHIELLNKVTKMFDCDKSDDELFDIVGEICSLYKPLPYVTKVYMYFITLHWINKFKNITES